MFLAGISADSSTELFALIFSSFSLYNYLMSGAPLTTPDFQVPHRSGSTTP